MNGFIVILIIVLLIAVTATINEKFGSIPGTIVAAVVGAFVAHEVLGSSWTLMGALVFGFCSFYCFGPSVTSLIMDKIKNKDKK